MTLDNTTLPDSANQVSATARRLGINDPLLQELWLIKAAFNANAGFNVEKRAEQARAFDQESLVTRLRQQLSH